MECLLLASTEADVFCEVPPVVSTTRGALHKRVHYPFALTSRAQIQYLNRFLDSESRFKTIFEGCWTNISNVEQEHIYLIENIQVLNCIHCSERTAVMNGESPYRRIQYMALFKLLRNFTKIQVVCAVNYLHNLDYKTRQMEIYWIYHTSIRGRAHRKRLKT